MSAEFSVSKINEIKKGIVKNVVMNKFCDDCFCISVNARKNKDSLTKIALSGFDKYAKICDKYIVSLSDLREGALLFLPKDMSELGVKDVFEWCFRNCGGYMSDYSVYFSEFSFGDEYCIETDYFASIGLNVFVDGIEFYLVDCDEYVSDFPCYHGGIIGSVHSDKGLYESLNEFRSFVRRKLALVNEYVNGRVYEVCRSGGVLEDCARSYCKRYMRESEGELFIFVVEFNR